MPSIRTTVLGLAMAATLAGTAHAQSDDTLKVGVMLTLSGPAGVIGEQARDAFLLAVEDMGGKLGGLETEVIVVDDELKPDNAVNKAKELVERDKVDFVVGPIFSNIMMAIAKPVTQSETILISPNAGTSVLAGPGCSEYLFVTSYQNDQVHEVLGKVAEERGYKRTRSPASSTPTPAKSPTRSTPRSASSTSPPNWRASRPRSRTRCSPSCLAAWA